MTLYRLHERAFHATLKADPEAGVQPDLLCARCKASEAWPSYDVAATARHWSDAAPSCAHCRSAIDATPVVASIAQREERMKHDAEITPKAEAMWAEFDDNEKTAVRFGMFPATKMSAAEALGYDTRRLALALMALAERNGGMRA